MLKLSIRPTLCFIVCLSALASGTVLAKDARWFRVELAVFSHEAPAANATETSTPEQFEPTPALAYPGAARFLIEPARVAANLAEYPGNSTIDEYGRQLITIGGAPTAIDAAAEQRPLTTTATALLPTPFVALPSKHQEFRGKVAYMQRRGLYTTLFHETWLQPMTDRGNSLPVIIDQSGDTGQWPRLQGSVKLYLSRYLHLETNLWLNTSGDYLPGQWRMPAPPLAPQSLIIEDPGVPEELPEPYPVEDVETAEVVEEGPVYPWRHAVLLKQKRRMRSKEVHYIDHPLLGIIIEITPASAEELSDFARAEATENPVQGQ